MIRVGVLTPDPGGAVSFYRVMGPFNLIEKNYQHIEIVKITSACWSELSRIDVLFMHRCTTDQEIEVLNMARIGGIKIWIDYDDNLTEVPSDSPAFNMYENQDGVKQNIKKVLSIADIVTCATPAIRSSLVSILERPIFIVQNALNDSFVKRNLRRPTKSIIWRGSKTHVNDLVSNKEMIRKIAEKHPDHAWYFIGQYPWMFTDEISSDKLFFVAGSEPYKYHQTLLSIAPEFMVVPLVDTKFNHAKSNIAWIEGTWAGAKVFASDLPEFLVPGCGIPSLGIEPDLDASWSYIQENLLLSHVNKIRVQLIESLV